MPISGVGVKPDGTLGWVDANGNEVNPDGTAIPGAQKLQPLPPAANVAPQGGIPLPNGQTLGGSPATPPPAPPAKQDTSIRDGLVQQLAAEHKGQIGGSSPVTTSVKIPAGAKLADGSPDPDAGTTVQQASGYDVYNFNDGTSIEFMPNGNSRNLKLGTGSNAAQTPADVAAKQNQLIMPNGQVYIENPDKSPGSPPYILDTQSQNNLQLANAKVVADTNAQAATAKKQQIDNAIASETDPAKLAQLQNSKTQADIDYQNAQTAKSQADVAYQNGMLGVAQQNAGSTAANAASTAARVGPQNALDLAQAGAQTTTAQNATQRLPSQIALDTAQAANQQAAADAARLKAVEPTVWGANITAPTQQVYDPKTGQVTTQTNPNYLPTDPGRMTAQLQQQAAAQQSALQQQVQAGKLTPDQAASQFNQYWQQNIEPVKGDIAAAQAKQQAALDYQQSQTGYEQQLTAMLPANLAQTASDAAQRNAISMMPYMVNSSAATTPGVISNGPGKFPTVNAQQIMANATYSLPNLQEIGRQGAAAALANISPTAAMHAQMPGPLGQPPVQGMPNVNQLLNQGAYGFGGGAPMGQAGAPPPPVAAPPPPPPPPAAPPGMTAAPTAMNMGAMPGAIGGAQSTALPGYGASTAGGFDWNALLQRQQQDAALQQMQAGIPWGTYQPAMS